MTREEEIKQAMDKICEFKAYPFNRGFIAGALWADEHPKNPWRDAKNDPPKQSMVAFTVSNINFGQPIYLKGIWDDEEKKWMDAKYWTPLPCNYWMPIPELPKGGEK